VVIAAGGKPNEMEAVGKVLADVDVDVAGEEIDAFPEYFSKLKYPNLIVTIGLCCKPCE
jgi:hypothetical protein